MARPNTQRAKRQRVWEAETRLLLEHRRYPTQKDVAAVLGWSPRTVRRYWRTQSDRPLMYVEDGEVVRYFDPTDPDSAEANKAAQVRRIRQRDDAGESAPAIARSLGWHPDRVRTVLGRR